MKKSFMSIYDSSISFVDEIVFNRKREFVSTEKIDFEGRPISQSIMKIDTPNERYKGLKGVDFSLENQLAVGAELPLCKCDLPTLEIEKSIKS